jgi:hypothetical protein
MRRNLPTVIGTGLLLVAASAGAVPLESWDTKIDNPATRFKVLAAFGNAAVLDKETQLVWEQAPSTTTFTWGSARAICAQRATGGRRGWRLPSVHELVSLTNADSLGPLLAPGHPFSGIQTSFGYWTGTTDANDSALAWYLVASDGHVSLNSKSASIYVWCVRGGGPLGVY